MKTHRNQTIPCRYIYHTLGPQNHEKMQVLIPRNMGKMTVMTRKIEGIGFPWYMDGKAQDVMDRVISGK